MNAFIKKMTGSTMISVLCMSSGNAQSYDSNSHLKIWTNKEAACFQSIFHNVEVPLLAHNPQNLIDYLKKRGFSSNQLNKKEANTNFLKVIAKHKELMCSLFGHDHETLFSVANRFFEYCFSSSTWGQFKQLLKTKKDYPITRFLYSTMWYNLAGDGWKNWNIQTLQTLQEKCKNGDGVVYIAGGTDIYQLLDYGIYTIKIIDPMLPSQPNYYTDMWDWLISGELGDQLLIQTTNKNLILKRYSYHKNGEFHTSKSGPLPQSLTIWQVYDHETEQQLGTITYDRRFCRQDDFCKTPNQHLLISFNELYFLTTVDNDNWGIEIKKLPKDFIMHVKQLQQPINKKTLCNMHAADASDFCFIRLGSSIN